MPTRSQVAQRVLALTLLASFAACSHGGEPRQPIAGGGQQAPAKAVGSSQALAHSPVTDQSKRGIIRAAEPLPAPEVVQASAPAPAPEDAAAAGAPRQQRAAAQAHEPEAGASSLPDPHLSAEEVPAQPALITRAAQAKPSQEILQPIKANESTDSSYWPIYVGAGVAGLSLLALALLRRRDRKAAQDKLNAEQAHIQELERADTLAREAAARVDQERRAAEAAATAAAEEAAAAEVARVRAEVTAAFNAAREQAERKQDPRIEAGHRLFDLLHRAERDVEPFLYLLDEAAPRDASTTAAREIVASWHESMLSTRNKLSEALTRHDAPPDMYSVEPATDLASAMSRLIDHAARMSALMAAQQQENSAILHWSRQLPGALVQLFWRAQTARYSSTMPQLPKVPDAPAPGAIAAPAPQARPAATRDKAVQQALRGVQGHAVRS